MGGQDCSVRFWGLTQRDEAALRSAYGSLAWSSDKSGKNGNEDVSVRVGKMPICVQEITAHNHKAEEGVLAVVYHASAPQFASAEADGLVRTYH